MTPHAGRLLNYTKCSGFVKSSSQESIEIEGKGDLIMECVLRDGSVSSFRVCDGLHVPKLGHPLISWRKLRTEGYTEFGEVDFISINKGTKGMFEAAFDGNLFKIQKISQSTHITYDYWHQALGHLAPSSMDKALKLYFDAYIPAKPKDFICTSSVKSKMTRNSRPSTSRKDRHKLDLVNSDLSGPFPVLSHGNSIHYITVIDDARRVAWVLFMKQKSETTKIIKDFVTEMEQQHHNSPKAFRTDNGGEYVTKALKRFFKSKGIIHEFTPPYSPESNGVAERLNRTIGEALRAMLESAVTYDKMLWAEAVLTSIYLIHHQPHLALKDLTPYEAFSSSKPSIQHLQRFGRECYIHVPYQKRKDGKNLSPRDQRAIFTGYTNTTNHYRVFLPNTKKTIVSPDISFPPLQIEGVTPQRKKSIHQHQTPSSQTSLDYTYTNKGEGTDDLWRQWMKENPQQAIKMFDTGHPTIDQIILADFKAGKTDGYLGAPFWVYDDNDMAYRKALPVEPLQDDIQSFDGSVHRAIPDDHFFEEEEEHQNPDQQSQHPLGHVGLPHPRPMTPPQIPFGQVVTHAGRVVNPPDRYGFGNDATKLDAPLPSPSPTPELERLEGSQWAKLSVLLIDEPKSYRVAKASPQWSDWKKTMEDELESLKENDVSDVIPKPVRRQIVASRWVFKVK